MRWLLALTLLAGTTAADEGLLNKLLAPGPLVKGHAPLEGSDCLKCHDAGQGIPDSKCLDCHKEIRPFVTEKRGFHGLTQKSCHECHSEHKGRDFNSLAIDERAFDHFKMTGYALEGKHADIKCADCHKSKLPKTFVAAGQTRFLGNSSTCVSCHKKDDVHFFKGTYAKKDCAECHSSNSWKEGIKFDHKEVSGYPLLGRHKELSCTTCHTPKDSQGRTTKIIYKWPQLKSAQCLTCHDDHHGKSLSPRFRTGNCAKCHSQDKWTLKDFSHEVTGYPLLGRHKDLQCIECHKQPSKSPIKPASANFIFAGLKKDCLSCHANYHRFKDQKLQNVGRLLQCQSCHSESSWKDAHRFNHNLHTRFPMDGEHLKLNCIECHVPQTKSKVSGPAVYRWPQLKTKTCETCHKSPHLSQFSPALLKKACTECHVTSGWYDMKDGKAFDHSKTRFPLDGAHLKTRCTDCHGPQGKQKFKFASSAQKFCIDCHDNIHKGQFSTAIVVNQCTLCHTTKNFTERLEFDHSKTRYPLEGAHRELQCAECHVKTGKTLTLTPPNIASPRKDESPTKLFELARFSFPNVKRTECLSCHADFHKGQLSSSCLDCHAMNSWKIASFNHNKLSEFHLRFKHEQLKCIECHKPIRGKTIAIKNTVHKVIRYKPINHSCVTCHKDVHRGEFGAKCQECHTEKRWRVTRDFHKNFTLTGVHYGLDCAECHRDNRKLAGLSQSCVACHAKDDVHNGTLPQCQDCHRQNFWEVTRFKHSLTLFPLRGAHRTLDCMQCHRGGTYQGLSSLCSSCHLSEALAVPAPNHSGFSNLNSCTDCHRNQFAW